MVDRMIVPLNQFMDHPTVGISQAVRDDIISGFRATSVFDGTWYSLPFSKSVRVLFYNRDLFDAHNLQVPRTWDEVLHAARILTDEDAGRRGFGFENAYDMEWVAMLFQNGGMYIDEATNQAVFASPAGIDAATFVMNLINSDYGRTAGADGFMSGVFGRQDVAMYIGSSAGLPHVTNAVAGTFNWGTAPTPGTGAQRVEFAGNDLIMFDNPSHEAEERVGAWEFMRFTLQPETSARWAMASGYVPVTYAATNSTMWRNFVANENPRAAAAANQLPYGFFRTRVVEGGPIRTILQEELENMMFGTIGIAEGLTRAQNRANDVLAGR
jgi:multiple sugar transport system substrate-binding protein